MISHLGLFVLYVGLLLSLKHWVFDAWLQTPYQYLNKGNWKHPGGYLHAGLHGLATGLIFSLMGLWWLGIVDAVVHYVTDWTKVNLTKKYAWSEFIPGGVIEPRTLGYLKITSNYFFYALVADQCIHFATYITLIAVALS